MDETAFPQTGNSSSGMKMPLMKTNGNLIMDDNIIMVDGLSVGGYAESSMLNEAKQKVERTTPKTRIRG